MEHVAIMKKSWKLTEKILSGQKRIESRWYMAKYAPWDRIKSGETVYFKESGEPVTAKAEVEKVMQFSNLTPKKVREILHSHSNSLGIDNIPQFINLFKDKKYCMLVFLKNPKAIEPFEINKSGFGNMSAWICTVDVGKIKV